MASANGKASRVFQGADFDVFLSCCAKTHPAISQQTKSLLCRNPSFSNFFAISLSCMTGFYQLGASLSYYSGLTTHDPLSAKNDDALPR